MTTRLRQASPLPRALTARMKNAVARNKERVYQEIIETRTLYQHLLKWSRGETLAHHEKAAVKAQLLDICKTVPALAIFLAPFGSLVLALLIKVLPFDIMPSAFLTDSRNVKKQERHRRCRVTWRDLWSQPNN